MSNSNPACEVSVLYLGLHQQQLRYFSPERDRIPTLDEAAIQAQQQAEQAQQQAQRLVAQLRSLGIKPQP